MSLIAVPLLGLELYHSLFCRCMTLTKLSNVWNKTQDAHLFFQGFLTGPKLASSLYPLGPHETHWKKKSQGRVSGRQAEVPVWVHFGCRNGMVLSPTATFASGGEASHGGTQEPSPISPRGRGWWAAPPPHPVQHCCSSLSKMPLPHTTGLSPAASPARSHQDGANPHSMFSFSVLPLSPAWVPNSGPKSTLCVGSPSVLLSSWLR